jgi:beta-lactamase superfamily II metal-dependent hydrolase
MYEIDCLAVGDGRRSGEAVAMRFTQPDGTLAHVIIDGGFQDDGDDLVAHVRSYYGTSHIDVVVLTHPDGDHIGGLGTVIRALDVDVLLTHRLSAHGGGSLAASAAVEDLISVATQNGTAVREPFAGVNFFDGALVVAGPDVHQYEALVAEQVAQAAENKAAARAPSVFAEAFQKMSARALSHFPIEIPFDDAGGTNPRNNSSVVVDIRTTDRRLLFAGDAGVPTLGWALDNLDSWGRTDRFPDFMLVPHHGSRHNASSALLDRMLGPKTENRDRTAYISISAEAAQDPRYPSPRVSNGYGRRGYSVYRTAGIGLCHSHEAPERDGWFPTQALEPLDESIDER